MSFLTCVLIGIGVPASIPLAAISACFLWKKFWFAVAARSKKIHKVEIVSVVTGSWPKITLIYKPKGFDSRVQLIFEHVGSWDEHWWKCYQDKCVEVPFWLDNLLDYEMYAAKEKECNECRLDTFKKNKVD